MTLRAILAALLMVSPAAAQPPGPGTLSASNAFIACLVKAADKYDDGHSDPASVARSIQAVCASEEFRWEEAQTANYSAAKKRDFLEKIKGQTAAIALQTVLEQRRVKFGK